MTVVPGGNFHLTHWIIWQTAEAMGCGDVDAIDDSISAACVTTEAETWTAAALSDRDTWGTLMCPGATKLTVMFI
jgi:hypothetical protein